MSKKCTPLGHKAHLQVKKLKNAKKTSRSEHSLKLRRRKSARRCGAKHICKWKSLKKPHVRSTFWSWDVEKVHAVVARSTFRSQNFKNTRGSDRFWAFRCRFAWQAQGIVDLVKSEQNVRVLWHFQLQPPLHHTTLQYTTLQLQLHLHYIPLHYTTLHYTTLHTITLNYAQLHYTTLHSIPLHYTPLHYTTLHYTTLTLHDTTLTTTTTTTSTTTTTTQTALHHITLHFTILHTTLHYTTHYSTLHYTTLHSTTLHYTTLH